MRVVLDVPERLIFRHIPVAMPLMILAFNGITGLMAWGYFRAGLIGPGMLMLGIGLLLFIGTSPYWAPYWLTFDRATRKLTLRRYALFGKRHEERSIAGLQGASTQMTVIRRNRTGMSRHERKRPDPKAWRAVLVFRGGRSEPLTEIYGPEREAGIAAAAINGWVQAGETL